MIAVIGEMAVSFTEKDGTWNMEFSGLGYEWACRLKDEGEDVLLLTVLPYGKTGKMMADELVSREIVFDPDIHLPLNPVISINGEWYMKSSSAISLSAEKLTDALSYFSDIKSVVVSSSLLSYNPSSSSILDSLSFMYPQPRVAVDTGCLASAVGQDEMMKRTIRELSSSLQSFIATDDKKAILDFVR